MAEGNENLISIEEFIARAKKLGVDFGKGDPKNRLRYYVKIGLLPHAQRKSFNGLPPNGAYPESILGLLLEIDKKLKAGKSIQAIKRELKEEKEKEEKIKESLEERVFETPYLSLPLHIYKPSFPEIQKLSTRVELGTELVSDQKKVFDTEEFQPLKKPKFPSRFSAFFKSILFIVSIFGLIVFIANTKINFKDSISYFLASIGSEVRKLTQLPPSLPSLPKEEIIVTPSVEPYLTINAETAINGPLNVKESISSPAFIITKEGFQGFLTLTTLTADRTYTFPNQSGIVCLSTGNCVGLSGEVLAAGGTTNRLAKFVGPQRIGNSSINDLYSGISISIGPTGNVGIGIENPAYNLHVQGRIQASGDICTDLGGGRCLSRLAIGGGGAPIVSTGVTGLTGSGSINYLPIWTGATTLGNSLIFQTDGNIGIGTTTPAQKLDVAGTIRMLGFQLPTNAAPGYILTSDASGFGTWQPAPSGTIPSGIAGQTLRHDGTSWIANSFLYNDGSAIGIGTTSTLATLTVAGDGLFQGPLTISTTTLAQLILKYNDDNYLRFSISSTSSEILSSKTMLINSLTGEIRLGGDVNLFNATSAIVWGKTFVSPDNDATVRKSGELVLRSSIPIFKFPVPAQTTSTEFVATTREFSTSTLNNTLPPALPGTTRKFAFLINFADNIPTSASSTWLVDLTSGSDIEFYFAGQNFSQLDEGVPHLSDFIDPPTNNWRLKVKVPSGTAIRIFNILLLVFDQIL